MILVWWRECPSLGDDNGYWQVSTQTVIEAEDPWPRLLRKFLNLSDNHTLSLLDKQRTYVFELCTKENRIITAYPDERLYLLASIHNESGDHMSLEELDRLAALLKVHLTCHFRSCPFLNV